MKEFKLIVAGGRDFTDYPVMSHHLNVLANVDFHDREVSIVSGMAKGADWTGVQFAKANNVRLYQFSVDWTKHGKRAGFMRNVEMAVFSDGLLAFWDGNSRGTKHMIETMQQLNKYVKVIRY